MEPPRKDFTEKDAGIEEFLAKESVEIPCIIKHRYSDFIVNEINQAGEVVWFRHETDLEKWRQSNFKNTLPESVKQELKKIEEADRQEQTDLVVPKAETISKLRELMGDADTDKFVEFCSQIESKSIEESTVLDLSGDYSDKEKRTEVH